MPGADNSVEVSRDQVADAQVVRVRGEVDMATVSRVRAAIQDALAAPGPSRLLVVDLSGVSFFGSAGLSVLAETRARCADGPVDLRVVLTDPMVARPLEITGLDQVLSLHASLRGALDGD